MLEKSRKQSQTKNARVIANRYRVVRKIGSGNFGVVFLVNDLNTEELKVLKEIDIGNLQPDETIDAAKEANLLSSLNHPHIVRFYESFVSDGSFCIVTEYCEGGDLDEKIKSIRKSSTTLDETLIVTWFIQLLSAVQYIHKRRILHRDLKARNIFLRNNVIKVGDFGISRVLSGTSDFATTFAGTPYYMSPEVLDHNAYNSKSDVWALACILYELCCLRHAFEGQNLLNVMRAILEGEIPELPSIYHTELRRVYLGMLQRDPKQRFSISEVLQNPFICYHARV
ncbi:uncharacterized protein TRIADDRAFT_30735 [Trichoplax adhaerens]|uniref:non-specific serine/threonine protein kinase n=1 Tax=Trichoplax adhaerens TaxID=10228 RepID=B3S7E3_TRIAD|nr:hypothetical protein TRIADDRAFT_30735 [Trichoplax adhaerens]EDV21183.1 hypothetical protein TRIADDRAFT_30735 [Trichoplax adhaerens]|eukprot:XP_002116150.1 hypothetical protein TRIADDRAFT_30735 [Trichoplax adhaerens]